MLYVSSLLQVHSWFSSSPLVGDACQNNTDCDAGEYCRKPLGQCSGQGPFSQDHFLVFFLTFIYLGECIEVPFFCTDHYAPVIGCNGLTYGNSCMAASASQSVDRNAPSLRHKKH